MSSDSPRNAVWFGVGSLIAAVSILSIASVGCRRDVESTSVSVLNRTDPTRSGVGDFQRAIEFLEHMGEFEPLQTQAKILFHLRRWLSREDPNVHWIADPLAARLPERFRHLADASLLSQSDIEPLDVEVLLEATWLRDVARSAIEKNVIPPDLEKWLEWIRAEVPQEQQSDVTHALVLFDWVVRNIQTDADPTGGPHDRYGQDIVLQASEVLKLGHGTVSEKARVFLLLARQIGVTVVMLGIDRGTADPQDWLPAVLVGNRLLLFDMRLGIPVPRHDGPGIATLDYTLEHPEILRSLDQGTHVYPVSVNDLSRLVAMFDATPAYLSQRMANIESAMTGRGKLVLTVRPSPVATVLRSLKGITRVEIWTLPYRVYLERSPMDPKTERAMNEEFRLYDFAIPLDDRRRLDSAASTDPSQGVDRRVSLMHARLLHFRGQYETVDENRGARALYIACRKPNAEIESLRSVQKSDLGDLVGGLSETQLLARKQLLEQLVVRTKQNASFWLGLMAADRGDFKVAIDFFQHRNLDAYPDGPWTAAAKYNLARAHEALGLLNKDAAELERAKSIYLSDVDSPQTHQCLIRARQIDRNLAKPTGN